MVKLLGRAMVLGIFGCCLFAQSTSFGGQLFVADYACAHEIVGRMPHQIVDCSKVQLSPPLYLWIRLRGDAAVLSTLAPGDEIVIRHRWIRYAGPNPQIETVIAEEELSGGIIDLPHLSLLKQEVDARGYFDWRTWTQKTNLRQTSYRVEVVDRSYKVMPCTGDGRTACKIQIVVGGH